MARKIPTYDEYFMNIAMEVSTRSKDERTQVGSVIVGQDNNIRSTGYNSFPSGINDNVPERQSRVNGEKYYWFAHSEANAILSSAKCGGAPLQGCKIYVPGSPCHGCMIMILQAGITEIIVKDFAIWPGWAASQKRARIMARERGIIMRGINHSVIICNKCGKINENPGLTNVICGIHEWSSSYVCKDTLCKHVMI